MTTNKQIIQKIEKAKNIAIFGHQDPDPDACASMFGLRNLCQEMGKNAVAFCKDYGSFVGEIFPAEDFEKDFVAKDFDLVILVDMHVEARIEDCFVEEFRKCKNVVVIDHHILTENEVVPAKLFRIVYKASASQLVLDLFREIGKKPSKETATILYAGLMGDTDRFLHSNLSAEVFDDAKYLFECGADAQEVYNKMFRSISKKEVFLTNYLYSNLKYLKDGRIAFIIFTQKTMKRLGISIEDVKMFSNSIINIKGVDVSHLVYEEGKDTFKFSIRSTLKINLIPFVVKMGGGGHPNAAGFTLKTKASKLVKFIKETADEVLNG